MSRFTALEPLRKLVQQHDSAEAEMRRLEKLKGPLAEDREALLTSGRFDDEKSVARASTLQIKISMLPFKLRQLDELRLNVESELGRFIQALRNELMDEEARLARTANEALVLAVVPQLERFLGHQPDSVASFAQRIAERTLVVHTLDSMDLIGGQDRAPVEQARNLLSTAIAFERIREVFFDGDSLNLEAVAKVTAFSLAG